MNLDERFRKLVFFQVLMGIVAFCLAEGNPGLLLITGAIGAMSWYITEGPYARHIPRGLVNVGAILAVGWLVVELRYAGGLVIVAMGHFIMILQLLMLYADKSNREYAQLLVLSLLQMVGASALSITMVYGLMLAIYCLVALVTVLVFQLKATRDRVHESNVAAAPLGVRVSRPRAVPTRGFRWHMRMTAFGLAITCSGVAVAVFIVAPRTESRLDPARMGSSMVEKQAGFSNTVVLDGTAPQATNRQPVLSFTVTLQGGNIGRSGAGWLLRGTSLDQYRPKARTWTRSSLASRLSWQPAISQSGIPLAKLDPDEPMYHGRIALRRIHDQVLFSVLPVAQIQSDNIEQLQTSALDSRLAIVGNTVGAVIYDIRWPIHPPGDMDTRYISLHRPSDDTMSPQERRRFEAALHNYARGWRPNRRLIARMTRDILAQSGLTRDPRAAFTPNDLQIARTIEKYLSHNFEYSLDNTSVPAGRDPIVEFLTVRRSGHCELFAAAMTAMCRSIGMKARLVTGYRASEYNSLGGYYVVRESHAHAWTEVHAGPDVGWRSFDSTPAMAINQIHRPPQTWVSLFRQTYEYLEFSWISSVVAYDQRTRDAVLGEIKTSWQQATSGPAIFDQAIRFVTNLPKFWRLDRVGYTLAGLVIVMLGIAVASLARLLIARRRRMATLQLTALPRGRRRGMTRRLRFYLKMLELLERHGFARPQWQSPFGFARELADANPMRFDPVVSLTELFYEIRFGHRELNADRKQRIRAHIKQLEHALASRE